MELGLSLWNIHDWLDERGVEHFYTLEDDLPLFKGIRFQMPEVDQESNAVLFDVTDNSQYRSILSFRNGRIYFRFLQAADAMNLLNDMLFVYSKWQKSLRAANLSHANLEQLLSIAGSLFHLPLIVIRDSKNFSDPEFVASFYEALKDARFSDGSLLLNTAGYGRLIMSQITFRNHYVLLVAKAGSQKVTQASLLFFAQIRHAVSICLKNREETSGRYYDSAHYVFSSFADGSVPATDSLDHVLKDLRWQCDDNYQVFCLQFANLDLQKYPVLLYSLLENYFPCCFPLVREDQILLFLNASRSDRILDENAFAELFPADLLHIGQSNLHSGISNLTSLIRQAEQALLIARQTGKSFVRAQAISTQAVLKQFHSDSSLQAMVHPAVILLSELDKRSKSGFGYLNTLEAFLTSGTNISATSRKLQIHRNTLIHRIERIKELTGLSLTDPKELETLSLSLVIYDRDFPQ